MTRSFLFADECGTGSRDAGPVADASCAAVQACPAEPQSGVRLVDATPAYTVCIVIDKDGDELARGPFETTLRTLNSLAGAVSVVRDSDRAVLAVATPIPAPTVAAWLAKLGWMHQS